MKSVKSVYIFSAIAFCIGIIACVQPTYEQTIVFSVEAPNDTTIQTMSVRGGFEPLSWEQNFELKYDSTKSAYTGEVTLDTPFKFVELKFVKNENTFELDGQDNRRVYFDEEADKTVYNAVFDKVE